MDATNNYTYQKMPDQDRQYLMSLLTTQKNKSLPFAIALGRLIAKEVKVPNLPVESPFLYFSEELIKKAPVILDSLINFFPVDIATIKDTALKFAMADYEIIHGDCLPYTDGTSTGIAQFFRLNKHLSAEVQKEIETNLGEILVMMSKLKSVIGFIIGNSATPN